jgi:SNF2 family DNA or RNA helicase
MTQCKICEGKKQVQVACVDEQVDEMGHIMPFNPTETIKMVWADCSNCNATGEVPVIVREVELVSTPKDKILENILEEHDEDGRLVVYGGFTGSIDRICKILEIAGWQWIRVDGRGWATNLPIEKYDPTTLITYFQDKSNTEKVAFVGHPGSAGMGLTLTASSEIVYYSNDFNGENRMQSEDRIHRTGMDINKGALITDIIHLPSDQVILDNLKEKRRLQDMTLGQFDEGMKLVSDRTTLGEFDGET